MPFPNVAPLVTERLAVTVEGCGDPQRSQINRPLRQMMKNGQVPELSAQAGQFWTPQGMYPDQADAYGVPYASPAGSEWGMWR